MTRILLIGNSHLAAFKRGWDLIAQDHPTVSLSFFTQSGSEYYDLRLDPDARVFGALDAEKFAPHMLRKLDRLNDAHQVDLAGFDQIIVVGNQHGVQDLLRLLAFRRVTGLRALDKGQLLSPAALDAIVTDIAAAFAPPPTWGAMPDIPVTFHALPRPVERAFETVEADSTVGRVFRQLHDHPQGIAAALNQLAGAVQDQMTAPNLRFMEQPAATLTDTGFTKAEFNRNWESYVGSKLQTNDYSHMNPEYGALCLTSAFAALLPDAKQTAHNR